MDDITIAFILIFKTEAMVHPPKDSLNSLEIKNNATGSTEKYDSD